LNSGVNFLRRSRTDHPPFRAGPYWVRYPESGRIASAPTLMQQHLGPNGRISIRQHWPHPTPPYTVGPHHTGPTGAARRRSAFQQAHQRGSNQKTDVPPLGHDAAPGPAHRDRPRRAPVGRAQGAGRDIPVRLGRWPRTERPIGRSMSCRSAATWTPSTGSRWRPPGASCQVRGSTCGSITANPRNCNDLFVPKQPCHTQYVRECPGETASEVRGCPSLPAGMRPGWHAAGHSVRRRLFPGRGARAAPVDLAQPDHAAARGQPPAYPPVRFTQHRVDGTRPPRCRPATATLVV
jgi:hypothetical protein